MDPIAALRRIAFLLERTQQPTYRVKAFRSAALTVAEQGPRRIVERAANGTLRDLPGIGPKTAGVIEEALHGQVPVYLADLESAASPLADGGLDLLEQLRGDLHSHSSWSDGGSPIEEMAVTALELGREYLALTDHSPD